MLHTHVGAGEDGTRLCSQGTARIPARMGISPSRFLLMLTPNAGSAARVGLYPQAGQSPNTKSSLYIQTGSVPGGLSLVLVTWCKKMSTESWINNSFHLQVLSSVMSFQIYMVLNTRKLKHFQTDGRRGK